MSQSNNLRYFIGTIWVPSPVHVHFLDIQGPNSWNGHYYGAIYDLIYGTFWRFHKWNNNQRKLAGGCFNDALYFLEYFQNISENSSRRRRGGEYFERWLSKTHSLLKQSPRQHPSLATVPLHIIWKRQVDPKKSLSEANFMEQFLQLQTIPFPNRRFLSK